MYINAFRSCSLLLPSYAFRSIGRNLTSNGNTNAVRGVGDQLGVKRGSRRFLRNFLLANGVIFGASSLSYFYYLTPKQRRQVRVTFEGFRRGLRLVSKEYLFDLIQFLVVDPFTLGLLLPLIINTCFGQYLIHHQNMI